MTINLSSEPCYSGTRLGRLPSPSAWVTGWKNGWDQPANTAARTTSGTTCFLAWIFAVIVFLVARMARRRGIES